MDNRIKNLIYSVLLIASVFIVWLYRKNQQQVDPVMIEGKTMGTTYHITYFDKHKRDFKPSVDSLLEVVNQCINTYLSDSDITTFNTGTGSFGFRLPYFLPVLEKSKEVFLASSGAFDPTVMPLVNAWGFGPAEPLNPGNLQVDSIRTFVGFEKIQFNQDSVWKLDNRTQLDFGGIGQGYGADVIVEFLRSKGIKNMLVEVGGEGMACGKNLKNNSPWRIGILDPASTPENMFFTAYVSLEDKSFTTSGNYFNYREINGKKYSHSIDPSTGYPSQKEILSASVFSKDGITADAWATAFMVMGHEKAIEILNAKHDLDGFLIYTGADGSVKTYATKGIEPYLSFNE
ncbi:MAG: FAD:protein FMN transferase [Cyclobacteriaceae bacterium]|jgi:thiamine biosynthesis lipoprotein|nr:FAD:protein FMN transferase [Cyclobacteriaceae bacterium]